MTGFAAATGAGRATADGVALAIEVHQQRRQAAAAHGLRRQLHARTRPFPGVVDEVANHFLKILPPAAKPQGRRAGEGEGEGTVAINLLEGAH